MKVKLVVGQGPHKGKEISVPTSARYVIGRSSDCQLRPASQAISKRHCALQVRDNKLFVEDLDSTNGTFINDKPIKGEHELANGDMLKVGPLDFVVKLIDAVGATPASPQAEIQTHSELQTQVEAKPAPSPAKKPSASDHPDDEAVAAMLLDIDDAAPEPKHQEQQFAEDSTMMDLLIPQKETGGAPPPYRPKDVRPQQSSASTSNAAKEILDKYRRRPRS